MDKELTVKTNSRDYRIFMQSGFYKNIPPSRFLHAHSFTELHFVACEGAVLNIDGCNHSLKPGSMAVIPKEMYHCSVSNGDASCHTAFQIDYDAKDFKVYDIGETMTNKFFEEITELENTDDYSKFSAFVAFFASCFDKDCTTKARAITNYRFLIREFFSQRYNEDIHLCDLAKLLNVSPRHAERLTIEYMGKSFKEELTRIRIKTAQNLLRTTSMSLADVASYVGYKSYSGFWKAMQRNKLSKFE